MVTFYDWQFWSRAFHLTHCNKTSSSTEMGCVDGCSGPFQSQLSANDSSIGIFPCNITNSLPVSIYIDFYSSFKWSRPPSKTDTLIAKNKWSKYIWHFLQPSLDIQTRIWNNLLNCLNLYGRPFDSWFCCRVGIIVKKTEPCRKPSKQLSYWP